MVSEAGFAALSTSKLFFNFINRVMKMEGAAFSRIIITGQENALTFLPEHSWLLKTNETVKAKITELKKTSYECYGKGQI
jgi:hypothetical protein